MKDSDQPSAGGSSPTNSSSNSRASSGTAGPDGVKQATARPRTIWTYLKWTTAVTLCVLAVAAGAVLGNFSQRSKTFATILNGIGKHPITFLRTRDLLATYKPELTLPPDKQHVINLLLMGCDHDYIGKVDKQGYVHPIILKNSNGRSDSLMIARVDFDEKTIRILSIPRDTAVVLPKHGLQKINAAYQFGGPELSRETIKNVFGVDADYYVTLNFEAFQQVVDAIGGVDITVRKKMNWDDNWGGLHIHLKPGFQHLDGYNSMCYVRFRHSDSDLMRAERQHEFLEAMRSKVMSPESFMKLPNVLNAVMDNVKTDMNQEQLLTLANFARQLPKEKIELATLPNVEGPSYCYVKAKEGESVISRMFFDGLQTFPINAPERGDREVATLGNGNRSQRKTRRRPSAAPATDAVKPSDGMGDTVTITDPDKMPDMSGAGGDRSSPSPTESDNRPDRKSDPEGEPKSKESKDNTGETI